MKTFSIKQIGTIVSGSTPKSDIIEYWEGQIPWVTPKDLSKLKTPYLYNTERKISEQGLNSCSAKMLPKGSILFSSRAPIGHIAINEVEVCTNQGFKSIVLNKGFYPLFIYYLLKHLAKRIEWLGTGTTFKELSKSTFEKFRISVPEKFHNQVRIASLLYLIEETINKQEEAIFLLDELVRGKFFELFANNIKSEEFQTTKIGVTCDVTKLAGYEYSKYINYKDQGEIAIIRGLNVKNGLIKKDSLKYIDKSVSNSLLRSKLNIGDVVMTYIGINIGDAAIVKENNKYHLGPNVCKITAKDLSKIKPNYLLYYLLFNRRIFAKYTTNTAKQALSMGNIREIEIVIPPIQLQDEFSQIIDKIALIKEQKEASLLETKNLLGSLNQTIFDNENHVYLKKVAIFITSTNLKNNEDISDTINAKTPQNGKVSQTSIGVDISIDSDEQTTPNWNNFSTKQLSDLIILRYKGFHFSFEMLHNYLTKEFGDPPVYYTSKELKNNRKLDFSVDIKEIVFSSLDEKNPFLKLKQCFYDSANRNFKLNLIAEDKKLLDRRPNYLISGIYFKILT